jgi:catechol 2,3-dioxygenase-like lactoylglutathione lyase family enzyme
MPPTGSVALKVSNLILRVSDMERSVAFYRDQVGLALRFAGEEFSGFDAGSLTLMLNRPETPSRAANAGLSALTEIVLEAADIGAAHAALAARGVEFRVEPRVVTSDGQRDLLAADFRDPDGHVLSLTGWVPRSSG